MPTSKAFQFFIYINVKSAIPVSTSLFIIFLTKPVRIGETSMADLIPSCLSLVGAAYPRCREEIGRVGGITNTAVSSRHLSLGDSMKWAAMVNGRGEQQWRMAEHAMVLPINEEEESQVEGDRIRPGCHVLKIGFVSEEFCERENLVLGQFWE